MHYTMPQRGVTLTLPLAPAHYQAVIPVFTMAHNPSTLALTWLIICTLQTLLL